MLTDNKGVIIDCELYNNFGWVVIIVTIKRRLFSNLLGDLHSMFRIENRILCASLDHNVFI